MSDTPGTPLARLNAITEKAVSLGLCKGIEAKAPETFVFDEIERLKARCEELRNVLARSVAIVRPDLVTQKPVWVCVRCHGQAPYDRAPVGIIHQPDCILHEPDTGRLTPAEAHLDYP